MYCPSRSCPWNPRGGWRVGGQRVIFRTPFRGKREDPTPLCTLIGNVFFALQHPIGWIGVILLATAIAGICPLYSLLDINTKSAAEKVGLK